MQALKKENQVLNAYVKVTEEQALATAKKVDEKIMRGESLLPLEGIPMSLKDNISTKGIETTCCSKKYCRVILQFTMLLSGIYFKIKMQFYWVKPIWTNLQWVLPVKLPALAVLFNPHNPNHVAGGSSGGAASCVSGNIAVFGLGSDTGGSIRQPASFLRRCWLKANLRNRFPLRTDCICFQL